MLLSGEMSDPNSSEIPQFTTAEYSQPAGDRCAACKQPITAQYYRVYGKMACPSCAEQLQRTLPRDSHSAYVRWILFGAGAALLGLIFYSGFTILTGLYVGYISFAVGWFVAKAILLGSKGVGGRRYQILAVLLTYAAVSVAAIPIAVYYQMKSKDQKPAVERAQQPPSADGQASHSQDSDSRIPVEPEPQPKMSLGAAVAQLLIIGLASPFLELQNPVHGLIGLVILFAGLRIAWRMTAGVPAAALDGPFDNSASASSSMR